MGARDQVMVSGRSHLASVVNYRVPTWGNQPSLVFNREVLAGAAHLYHEEVPTNSMSVEMLGDLQRVLVRTDGWDREEAGMGWLLRFDADAVSHIVLMNGWATIHVASNDYERARALSRELAERIRAFDRDESVTPMTFWCLDQHTQQPLPMRRKIDTPSWASIAANYTDTSQAGMGRLLELDTCPKERMILWHGPSGTGKTHALRALCREWAGWCDVAIVSDPEEFIGGAGHYSPTYLFHVTGFRSRGRVRGRGTLVVLEDAGELMTGEARHAAGQGLSRLLNLTDGILGQGLDVMVLITTNEPLSALHPAVTRPGRLLSEIEFGPLVAARANEWLERRGCERRVDEPTTLAELYSMTRAKGARRHAGRKGEDSRWMRQA